MRTNRWTRGFKKKIRKRTRRKFQYEGKDSGFSGFNRSIKFPRKMLAVFYETDGLDGKTNWLFFIPEENYDFVDGQILKCGLTKRSSPRRDVFNFENVAIAFYQGPRESMKFNRDVLVEELASRTYTRKIEVWPIESPISFDGNLDGLLENPCAAEEIYMAVRKQITARKHVSTFIPGFVSKTNEY